MQKRTRRHARIRARVFGTAERPRLSVFKSNKQVYAQIINDTEGKTLVSASSKDIKGKESKDSKVAIKALGELVAKKALDKKIKMVVFDRGGFVYAGKIKDLADAARTGGLKF